MKTLTEQTNRLLQHLRPEPPKNRLSEIAGLTTAPVVAGIGGGLGLTALLIALTKLTGFRGPLPPGVVEKARTAVSAAHRARLENEGAAFAGLLVGAPFGAAAGAAAQPFGALAALMTKTRTPAEQSRSETKGRAVANLLVPGAASYNLSKRIGSKLGN